jgi:acetyl-CoA/propionyl-CoA carboxylase biotin carboxyl carrier protein
VSVSNGDTVEAGQVLLSVEAMKMEHQLVAPLDGTVHISVGSGDLVKADQVVATIHPAVPAGPASAEDAAEDTIEEAVIAMGAAE